MIAKLPRWVWIGTWVLAFVAGTINVVALLGFQHEAVTHLTGTTSLLGKALAMQDYRPVWHLLHLILSFVAGAVLAGIIVQDSTLRLGRRYGIALATESVLVALAIPLLQRHWPFGDCMIAMASGLQNALVTTYSGAIIRTTHLTGVFTDLGVFIGHALRGLKQDRRRIWLYLTIISGFLLGGIIGTLAFAAWSYNALWLPVALTSVTAFVYGNERERLKTH